MALTRRAAIAPLIGLGGLMSAACGADQPDAPQGGRAAAKPSVTIRYAHWGTPDYFVRKRHRADDFQLKFPHIKLEILHLQQGYYERILDLFVAGSPPDTHVLDMNKVQAYGKRDVILPLNDLAKQDKAFKLDLLHKQATEIMSTPKGDLLGMPHGAGPNLFFYNRDLFKRAGVATPLELYRQARWTWQTFAESARAVTKGGPGKWEVAGASTGLHRLWMNSNGGQEYDDYRAPKKSLYDLPANVAALQFLADLRHSHKVTPASFVLEFGLDDTQAFLWGTVAMMARWATGIGQFKEIRDFTWGMVPYPKGPDAKGVTANDYATSGTAIAKVSKHPGESWEWVKFSVDDDGQRLESLADGGVGVFFSEAANQEVIRQLRAIPTCETPTMTVDLMKSGNGFVRLLSTDEERINTLVNQNLAPIWSGTTTPTLAAARTTTTVNDFLLANPQ